MRHLSSASRAASRTRFAIRSIFSVLILLLLCPPGLHGQAYNGSIVGNVTDPSGAAVAGAKVTVVDPATGATFNATTTALGSYSIAQVPIGTYQVTIEQPNFKEFVSNGVEVHVSSNTAVNAVLEVGAVSEKVSVQADEVQVETTSAAVGEVISGTQVRELPLNGENFVGLTQLPGRFGRRLL